MEQPSSSGEEVELQAGSRWSWLSWFRGSRPQRLPAEDAEELQERGGQPSVAVVVEAEAGGGDGSGPLEATSSGSSSSGEGREAGQAAAADSSAEIQPRQSGSPRMARLPSRGQPTCLICLEEFRVRWAAVLVMSIVSVRFFGDCCVRWPPWACKLQASCRPNDACGAGRQLTRPSLVVPGI